jgi:glycosyltransferase involved in cell wall biosynthesis
MSGITALLRVKNEARWIARSLISIEGLCENVLVFDDHSTDATRAIVNTFPFVRLVDSPFEGLDEARDKNYMLELAGVFWGHGWTLMLDGDEALEKGGADKLAAMICGEETAPAYTLQVVFLWDKENQIRVDGVYRDFTRPSVFDARETNGVFRDTTSGSGSNFHCGSVPSDLRGRAHHSGVALQHFGYLHRADRLRKYEWYNSVDPGNIREDAYRHMVIGDIEALPRTAKTRHGGPLELIHWGGSN